MGILSHSSPTITLILVPLHPPTLLFHVHIYTVHESPCVCLCICTELLSFILQVNTSSAAPQVNGFVGQHCSLCYLNTYTLYMSLHVFITSCASHAWCKRYICMPVIIQVHVQMYACTCMMCALIKRVHGLYICVVMYVCSTCTC